MISFITCRKEIILSVADLFGVKPPAFSEICSQIGKIHLPFLVKIVGPVVRKSGRIFRDDTHGSPDILLYSLHILSTITRFTALSNAPAQTGATYSGMDLTIPVIRSRRILDEFAWHKVKRLL